MDADEIVMHEVDHQRVNVLLDLEKVLVNRVKRQLPISD
jgi:hypothetical protein